MTNRETRLKLLSLLDQCDAVADSVTLHRGEDAARIAAASGFIAFAIETLVDPIPEPADPGEQSLPVYAIDCTRADEPDGSGQRKLELEPDDMLDDLSRDVAPLSFPAKRVKGPAIRQVDKLVPLVKRHGGKGMLLSKIIPIINSIPHNCYIEPFVGGGSIYLNKQPALCSFLADRDEGLTELWGIVRDGGKFPELLEALQFVGYGRKQWETACLGILSPTADLTLNEAVEYYVRHRQSRGGMGRTFGESTRLRRGMDEYESSWLTALDQLPRVHERLATTSTFVSCCDVLEALKYGDGHGTLIYLDPPYVAATRTAKSVYEYEMTDGQHRAMLDAARSCVGSVAISGYHNPMYDEALDPRSGWECHEFQVKNHSGQGKAKQARTEVLWVKREGGE